MDWPSFPEVPTDNAIVTETMPHNPFAVRPPIYGLNRFADVFTPRQLHSLHVLGDLLSDMNCEVHEDALVTLNKDNAKLYADSVATFLAFVLDRCVDFNNSLCRWSSSNEKVMNTFGRQAIPMIWDFAEANLLGDSVGSWSTCSDYVCECIEVMQAHFKQSGAVEQESAADMVQRLEKVLVSTDPPYYNNIDYSDLSDFFYVWLRRSLSHIYPDLFKTVLTPKTKELVASPYRFEGNKQAARDHFESGFRDVFGAMRSHLDDRFPMTIYYAFKQADDDDDELESPDTPNGTTGWQTMLEAIIGSGFQITGTWPVRASQQWRQMSMGMNSLASYIVLTCRPRQVSAPIGTRKEFMEALRSELPKALKKLQHGNIAPVDLAQASLGPGMAVFSRYAKVIESDGSAMTVRTALGIINQVLDEVLAEQEGDFDPDTRWALAWFEQFGMKEEAFGIAETLSKAKNTAINGLVEAGVVKSKNGKVQLVSRAELPDDWNPATEKRLTVWETTQHLIRSLETNGESEAATLLNKLSGMGEAARELAYRLFSICERKKWAEEALAYNGLVITWPELSKLALSSRNRQTETQKDLFS
jgi:putative DNA methylase